jgi:hypothetical protein
MRLLQERVLHTVMQCVAVWEVTNEREYAWWICHSDEDIDSTHRLGIETDTRYQ